ncbi:MAG: hypothetical protein IJD54_02305 [Clostridia bacterium]|nr:hypothetical protein [Clostridia bacterium]
MSSRAVACRTRKVIH